METAYQLKFRGDSEAQLDELGRRSERLGREAAEIILLLLDDPYPPTAEWLRDKYSDRLRIKLNGWRIIYKVFEQDRVIAILAILRRDSQTYLNMMR
jgi:mRNA-degrading endonuclease RelE of RelBE toxin-antitoxin system